MSFIADAGGAVFGLLLGNKIFFREKKMDPPKTKRMVTLLNLAEDDWETFKKIWNSLRDDPEVLELQIIGQHRITPAAALAIHHLLKTRNPAIRLEVVLYSSIFDGTLLLLIPANKISSRSNIWAQIDAVERHPGADFFLNDWRKENRRDSEEESPFHAEYREVLSIINQHIDLKSVLNERIPLEKLLKDFGIGNEEMDKDLRRFFPSVP